MPRRTYAHKLGRPAPKEPTDQQKALIELVVQEPGPITVLGPKAGYKDTPGGHRAAREALKQPWCRAWLLKRVREELSQDAASARLEMARLASEAKSEYVRYQAAAYILDRLEKLVGPREAAQGLVVKIGLSADDGKRGPTIDITPAETDRESPDTEPYHGSAETLALPPPDTEDQSDSEDLPSSPEAAPEF